MGKQHVQVSDTTSSNLTTDRNPKNKKHYTDLIVYAVLKLGLNKDSNKSSKSIRKIAEEAGMSIGGVQSALKRLEESKDIFKVKEGSKNSYKFNERSEKFEMFDPTFIKNTELNNLQKSFYISLQKYLYIDKETGIGKTTYSKKELSEKTGMSEKVISERMKELENLGFLSRRLTSDKGGNSCEALEFNLPKFGQYILCALNKHEEDIESLKQSFAKSQEDYARVNMELNKMKSLINLAIPSLLNVEEAQIILD